MFKQQTTIASWNWKKQKAPGKYKRELHEMQAVDKQKLPRQCIMSIPHRLPTQSNHIEKSKHAGCNLCCLRLGIINSLVSSAVMRWRWKLVHDAENMSVTASMHTLLIYSNIQSKNYEAGKVNILDMSQEIIGSLAKPSTKSDMSWMTCRKKESGQLTSSVCCGLNDCSTGA